MKSTSEQMKNIVKQWRTGDEINKQMNKIMKQWQTGNEISEETNEKN